MTASPVSSPVPDADRRRDHIVACAASLFDESGYTNTSMQQIADAVQIAKPTLYHYFRRKDAILFQIHEEFIDILLAAFHGRAARTPPHQELLLGAMADILALMETHRGHVRTFFEHHRELPVDQQELIRGKRDEYEDLLVGVLQDGVAAGVLAVEHPRMTALAIFGMCNWAYQWYSTSGALRPEEIARLFGTAILDGIGVG